MADAAHPQPPRAPEIGRAFHPKYTQVVGVALLLAIVVLALFGAFGTSEARIRAEADPVRVEARYPTRLRFKTIHTIDIEVTNTSSSTLDSVVVRLERPYVDAFSTVSFAPSLTRLTAQAYEVELLDVEPGEIRPVSVEVQAEDYWGHPGFIEARAGEAAARVAVHTTVYP